MKRNDLIREIRAAAKAKGIEFKLARHGANHDVWSCDGLTVPIPRHREIGSRTLLDIRRELEPKLGMRWWL